MGVETRTPVINAQSLHFNMTNEGGVNDTFRLSKNIMGLWLVQECRRTWARQGKEYSYDDLTQLAAQARSLQTIIDPDDNDFLKPGDMPSRIQAYARRTHQPVPQTPGEIVRCCLEGIACVIAGYWSGSSSCKTIPCPRSTSWAAARATGCSPNLPPTSPTTR